MDAANTVGVLADIGSIAFVVDAAHTIDRGVQLNTGENLGRAYSRHIDLCIFCLQVIAVNGADARQLDIDIFGLPFQISRSGTAQGADHRRGVHFHSDIAGAAEAEIQLIFIGEFGLADNIAGAGRIDGIEFRRCHVNFEPIGGIEVNMGPFVDDQPIAFLVDLYIRQQVVISFHFYPCRLALGDIYVCRGVAINIFKAADTMVFGFDIAVALDPFTEEMMAGGKNEGENQ